MRLPCSRRPMGDASVVDATTLRPPFAQRSGYGTENGNTN
jgi:hypothetical protein